MRSFKIHAQLAEYTVKFPKRKIRGFDPRQNDGLCDFETKTIYINGSLPQDCVVTTFLHEVLHAIFSELGRDELTYNEPFVETLSQNLAKLFRLMISKGVA